MRIAFDAHCFTRPLDSVDRVLRILLLAAEQVDLETELWSPHDLRDDAFVYSPKVRALPEPGSAVKADFFWSPELTLPPIDLPCVATLHDVTSLLPHGRNPLARWKKQKRYRKNVNRTLKQLDHLVTGTNDARKRITAAFPKTKRKIATVPLFVDPAIKPTLGTAGKVLLDEHNLTPGFILFVGSMRKHKNWDGLMRAYAKLPTSLKTRHPLVYVGRNQPVTQEARALAKKLKVTENVHFTGVVSDKMLHALYGGAALLVCPSFMEGFGLPALEAMACGIPVVASDRTCIPEVLGKAPLYINPSAQHQITHAMETLLTDKNLRSTHIQAGHNQVNQYTPERTGQAMLNTLRGQP